MCIKKIVIAKQQCVELCFVPRVVIQLCNANQQNARLFKLTFNSIVCVFYMFSEHHVFIASKTVCTCSFYSTFFMQKCIFAFFFWKASKGPTRYYVLACLTSANKLRHQFCLPGIRTVETFRKSKRSDWATVVLFSTFNFPPVKHGCNFRRLVVAGAAPFHITASSCKK